MAVYSLSSVNSRYLSDLSDFRDVASLTDMVDSASAYLRMKLNVRLTAGVESMNMELVTGDYFRAAGIAPVLGRPLAPEDDRPGAAPVALASYALWENRYQRSPSILGSAVRMNGVSFTIVGVMPPGYQGMLLDWYAELPSGAAHAFQTVGRRQRRRLREPPRGPDADAGGESSSGVKCRNFKRRWTRTAARSRRPGYRLVALPAAQARFFPAYRAATIRFLWMLLAVSIAAVAIACFNLANLLLAALRRAIMR